MLVCLGLLTGRVYAVNDGFDPAQKVEGKHFVVYYDQQLDLNDLLKKLNITPENGSPLSKSLSELNGLTETLDSLYVRVGDILDMKLYSLQGNLKICRNSDDMKKVYKDLSGEDLKADAFYVNDLKTIYISADHFTKEILVHEMAHMIMAHYFVVETSTIVTEVLAGFVEYQFQKKDRVVISKWP
jgi:hypothetical protein